MKFIHLWTCILCAAACLFGTPSASAAPLLVGATLYPAPAEADPVIGAPLAVDTEPFSATPFYTGTLVSKVYDNDTSNPYGGLTFTFQLSNDVISADAIHRLTVTNFSGFLVDASYQIPTTDRAPTLVDRSASGTIGFGFQDAIGPGALYAGLTSALLVLQTNATLYQPSMASVINGSVHSVPSFSPDRTIPEPASILLLAIGSLGFAGFAYRGQRGRPSPK